MRTRTPDIDHTAPFEDRANAIINYVFGGAHHLRKGVKKETYMGGARWEVSINERELSTFDWSNMTALVLAAHHYAIRVCVTTAGMRLKLVFWERKRDGRYTERHPELQEQLTKFMDWNAGKNAEVG